MVKIMVHGGYEPVECKARPHPHNEALHVYTSPERVVVVTWMGAEDASQCVLVPAGYTVSGRTVVPRVNNGVWITGTLVSPETTVKGPTASPMQKWVSIGSFSNIVSAVKKLYYGRSVTVTYRGKIKLHGTNAGIQITPGGRAIAQSRNRPITPEEDNLMFAKWVARTADRWTRLMPCVVYGEWCGKGVQRGVAISEIESRQFCVFAITIPKSLHDGGFDANGITSIIYDPDEIARWLKPIGELEEMHILPWHHPPLEVAIPDHVSEVSRQVNTMTAEVAEQDPWVHKVFGIAGPGEGLVEFPIEIDGKPVTKLHEYNVFVFKSKGDKHVVKRRVDGSGDAAAATETPENVAQFVWMMVTEARCQQGLQEIGGRRRPEMFRRFLTWMVKDIEKEGKAELEAGGLTVPEIKPPIATACNRWWFQLALPPKP